MFAAVFRDYVTTIDEEQSAVLCEVVGDPLVFATTVLTHGERSLPWLRGMEIEKFRRMLPPLSAFLRHVSEQSANSALSLSARSLSRCLDTVWPEKVGASLSPVAREALQMKYSELFNRRPVRFRNSCRRLARVEEILPYVYGDKEFDTNQFANFGKKTLVDALAFIDEVRPMVRQFIADLETNGHEPAALLTMKSGVIGKRYPFLDSADCDELAAHTVQGGAVPPLYVLAKFLERDTERTSAIHRMSYGIEPESRRMSIDEIAERLSLTRERTRQISVLPLDLPPQLEPLRAVAARQVAERIYGEDDPLWKPLAADSLLTFTGSQMMGLVASVLGTFTLEELGPGHRLYLIPRPWQREVSVSTALTQVERHLARPLRQPVKVDLTAALRGSRGSADGVRVREELYDLIFDCYAEEPRVGRAGAHTMRIAPCRVNRGPAIEALLAECGKATTSSELLRLYNERYPDEQISTLIHFKTYLFLNPNILAKGKSGYFVLRSWANEYTGTRIEYVEQLIRRAGRPLSVAEVMDDYEKMFPNSRRETVQYYLCTYGKNRFTPYGHGLYGLAGVDYPGYTVVQ